MNDALTVPSQHSARRNVSAEEAVTKTCVPLSPPDAVMLEKVEFTRMRETFDSEEEMYNAPPTPEQLQDSKWMLSIVRGFPDESSA